MKYICCDHYIVEESNLQIWQWHLNPFRYTDTPTLPTLLNIFPLLSLCKSLVTCCSVPGLDYMYCFCPDPCWLMDHWNRKWFCPMMVANPIRKTRPGSIRMITWRLHSCAPGCVSRRWHHWTYLTLIKGSVRSSPVDTLLYHLIRVTCDGRGGGRVDSQEQTFRTMEKDWVRNFKVIPGLLIPPLFYLSVR